MKEIKVFLVLFINQVPRNIYYYGILLRMPELFLLNKFAIKELY